VESLICCQRFLGRCRAALAARERFGGLFRYAGLVWLFAQKQYYVVGQCRYRWLVRLCARIPGMFCLKVTGVR